MNIFNNKHGYCSREIGRHTINIGIAVDNSWLSPLGDRKRIEWQKDNKELYDLFDMYDKHNSLMKTVNTKIWAVQHREKITPL